MGHEFEAKRIVIQFKRPTTVEVGYPFGDKPLCYNMLKDAETIIRRSGVWAFRQVGPFENPELTIVMNDRGRVDVCAPLPESVEFCVGLLAAARSTIERHGEEEPGIGLKAG